MGSGHLWSSEVLAVKRQMVGGKAPDVKSGELRQLQVNLAASREEALREVIVEKGSSTDTV